MQKPIPQPMSDGLQVLDAIQTDREGPKGQMDIMDVLKKGFEARRTGVPFDSFAQMLAKRLDSKRNSLVQIGNTAFLVKRNPDNPKSVEFSVISADKPPLLAKNFSGFYKLLKNQGILFASTTEDTPEYIDIYKQSGVPMNVGQQMGFFGDERRPEYLVQLKLQGA